MLINHIDKCVCLCLDRRISLWTKLEKRVLSFGLCFEKFIVGDGENLDIEYDYIDSEKLPPILSEGIDKQHAEWYSLPNIYNAFKCWRRIFHKLREDKVKCVLILEDDAFFTNDFLKGLDVIQYETFDLCWLGGFYTEFLEDKDRFEIQKLSMYAGMHGLLVKSTVFDDIINTKPLGPMDWIIGSKFALKYRSIAVTPSIILQNVCLSEATQTDPRKIGEFNSKNGILRAWEAAEQQRRI